jgi:glyoxylase-like metal-dependent hydrolase (beta-lactamase superfamily II)
MRQADGKSTPAGGLAALGLVVLQRDWLSANNIVFAANGPTPATVVDTGYARHSAMTLALIDHALGADAVQRVINTHLHSDHCGGNAALQQRDATVQVWVPERCFDAAARWDQGRLSYHSTGQHCDPFRADAAIRLDEPLQLGGRPWQVHAAPGHDMDAVLLFEPESRTLIAGDALWEDRLAIIFPELDQQAGFGPTAQTLALIEALAPHCVIPGHGAVFEDVEAALAASRARLGLRA